MKPSLPEFATALIKALEAEQSSFGWNFDGNHVLYNDSGDVIYLNNFYADYTRAQHSDRPELLRKYAQILGAGGRDIIIGTTWDLARKNIYLAVRSRYDRSSATAARSPFVEDLELQLVYDSGIELQHVTEAEAEKWGQSSEAIREQAIQNLGSLKTPRWEILKNGVFRLVSEVAHQESFLLVDSVMNQLPFASSMVCMPVNHDVLLAANYSSTAALNALVDEAQRCFMELPQPISGTMVVRKDGHWQVYEPGPEVAASAAALKKLTLSKAYSNQQSGLRKRAMAKGLHQFIASFSLMRPSCGGALRSFCIWTEGASSSLPQTDIVVVLRNALGAMPSFAWVTWEQIQSVCGRRLKKTQDDPPRFIVESFPNYSELKVLEANAELPPKDRKLVAVLQNPNPHIPSGINNVGEALRLAQSAALRLHPVGRAVEN